MPERSSAYDEYNPLQKLAYTLVLLLIAPVIAVTGLALWARLGGRPLEQAILAIHFGVAAELVLFFFGHLVMVVTTGAINNVRSMVTGRWLPVILSLSLRRCSAQAPGG